MEGQRTEVGVEVEVADGVAVDVGVEVRDCEIVRVGDWEIVAVEDKVQVGVEVEDPDGVVVPVGLCVAEIVGVGLSVKVAEAVAVRVGGWRGILILEG